MCKDSDTHTHTPSFDVWNGNEQRQRAKGLGLGPVPLLMSKCQRLSQVQDMWTYFTTRHSINVISY